jgi:beta-lactam-binding protein with PASTA domain
MLRNLDLKAEWNGKGDIVAQQQPPAGAVVKSGSKVTLDLLNDSKATTRLPNVVGLTLREALRQLSLAGVEATVHGSGRVWRQTPQAGAAIRPGMRCVLECQARPVVKASMELR